MRERILERESTFSLDFPTIDPSNFGETKGKVDPHYKSYAWVPILWSFEKLWEVGVFSYLIYSLAKIHFKWLGRFEGLSGRSFGAKNLDLVAKSLDWFWTVSKLTVDCMCCLCVDMLLLC